MQSKNLVKWSVDKQILEKNKVIKYRIEYQNKFLSVADVLTNMTTNPDFSRFFNNILAEAPFSAFFFETPAMTTKKLVDEFEFVLTDSSRLAKAGTNFHTFGAHFKRSCSTEDDVIIFPNLKKNARLITPCPDAAKKRNYSSLAKFARLAPLNQQVKFWQMTAREYKNNLAVRPVWLSTSGLGVLWLHMRLDARPKYYQHKPYKKHKTKRTRNVRRSLCCDDK